MKVADYIAEKLFSEGIRNIFGVPGGASVPYLEAFRQAGLRFILTSEERSAGIMADVGARLTGVPGICHATFGPGATNLLTGIGGAFLDRSPVLAFTSEMPDIWLNRITQMNISHQSLFRPVTRATYRLYPENTQHILSMSLRQCREEYPGPVHLGLPSDIAEKEIQLHEKEIYGHLRESSENSVNEITELIKKSRNPVLAVGLTAARLKLSEQISELLGNMQVPVLITPMAKGLIDEEHPCYAGVLSHALSDYLEDIYSGADLIIGLGYDPVEYNYESWMPDIPLIHFDTINSDVPERNNTLCYTGKPSEWFDILGRINLQSEQIKSGLLQSVKEEMNSVFTGFTSHFGPVTALKVLKETLPPDTIVTADVGSHLHLLGQYWKTSGMQNLIITNGWSSMGFSLPAAIAVKLCRPASNVVCITGDGGFLMSAGEIVTALRCMTPIIIVIFSDGELNLIKLKQTWKDMPPYGINLYSDNLFGSEKFLGVRVINVSSEKTMREAVEYALMLNETVIINAMIDPDDYKWLIVRQK